MESGRTILTEIESKEILKELGIPIVKVELARNKTEAIRLSTSIGFPLAMKISSPDITHKTDIGGVKLGIKNKTHVKKAFDSIIQSARKHFPNVQIDGVTIQKMAASGVEIIIGITRDPQFGPVIMFGLGGVFVEIIQDVSFRILPLTSRDAHEMIKEIKGYPLLKGFRGSEPVDIEFLEKLLIGISSFIENFPQIKELDLNPVFAYKKGAIVVDARIILTPKN
jgi:acyl-CoA synthetase (NDP forming)